MDDTNTTQRQINRRNEIVSGLFLIIVATSFCTNYYTYLLRSNVLYSCVLAATAAAMLYLCWRRFLNSIPTICVFWYVAAAVICVNIFRTPFDINTYVDVVAFAVGCVMIGCCGNRKKLFDRAFYVIIAFALYYAVTLWIQVLLPEVYTNFLMMLPDKAREYVQKLEMEGTGYTGFAVNPGFTVAHMIAGIFAICARLFKAKTSGWKLAGWLLALGFLGMSVFMTGKRAPVVFMAFALMVMAFILLDKKKRNKWLKIAGISAVVLAVLAWVLQDVLRMIPVFDRIFQSLEAMLSGEDVSSNRSRLYAFAWQLARENPIFGIGWNQYRKATVGTVTVHNELDVHNIYLQMLCETGIVGLVIVVVPMLVFFFATYKAVRYVSTNKGHRLRVWRMPLLYSVAYQCYFLIYGFTENPLYDHNYVLMYFFACAITAAFLRAKERAMRSDPNAARKRKPLPGAGKPMQRSASGIRNANRRKSK